MSLPDIPIPADFYDGGGRKEQVDALVAKVRVPAVSEKTQTVTLRGDATIVVTDGEGNAITAPALVDVWFAATDMAAPSATGNTVAIGSGTLVQTVAANGHIRILTTAAGAAEVRVTLSGAADRYVMVACGGVVKSALLEIAVIE
jgi:hypothetical protein